MHPSVIATIDPALLTEESGYVLLGIIDGLAYIHLAPHAPAQRIAYPNGLAHGVPLAEGEEAPDGVMVAIHESPRPSFAAGAVVVYDPSPDPFLWDTFAIADPDLAAQLTPHQWAGE